MCAAEPLQNALYMNKLPINRTLGRFVMILNVVLYDLQCRFFYELNMDIDMTTNVGMHVTTNVGIYMITNVA